MISKITLLKENDEYVGFEVIKDDEVIQIEEDLKQQLANYLNELIKDNYLDKYSNMSKKDIRLDLMERGLLTERELTKNKNQIQVTELPKEANSKDNKKFKVSKKTLALIVSGTIAIGGLGVGIGAIINHKKKQPSTNNTGGYSDLDVELPDFITPSYIENDNLANIYDEVNQFNQNEMSDVAVFANTVDNYYQFSRLEFSQIHDYRYDNKYELTNEGTIIPFEKALELDDNNFIDKTYVKYFSDLRNQIIDNFFNKKDEDTGLVYINVAGEEIIRCLKFNQPITFQYNGENISIAYGNLSDEAKKIVLNIASDIYIATYDYDTFTYNNKDYHKNDLEDIISNLLYELDNVKSK